MRAIAAAVRRGRRRAESLMVDACTISPITGRTTNPDGTVTITYGAPVYSGACKLQQQRLRYPSEPVAGGHEFTVGPAELHVPVASTDGVVNGHVAEITASFDAANVGRRFRVKIDDRKALQTAVRLLLEEVVD